MAVLLLIRFFLEYPITQEVIISLSHYFMSTSLTNPLLT